jgi:hypothetical protein
MNFNAINVVAIIVSSILPSSSIATEAIWVLVSETDNEYVRYDSSHIMKNGPVVSLWVMRDYKKEQKMGEYSYKSDFFHQIINCQNGTVMDDRQIYYSGIVGGGNIVFERHSDTSYPFHPNSVTQFLADKFCVSSPK